LVSLLCSCWFHFFVLGFTFLPAVVIAGTLSMASFVFKNPTKFDQKGEEGRRVDDAPTISDNSGLVYFGNRTCPFAHRAWWTLHEKELDFDYIHVDLGSQKPAWYAQKINELGTVPCIFENGHPVYESMIVAEYLEEKYKAHGTRLLPEDPLKRAAIRLFISIWSEAQKLLYGVLMNQDRSKDADLSAKLHAELKRINNKMVAQSATGPYFLGSEFSFADIAIVPFLDRFTATLKQYRQVEIFTDETARLKELYEACKQRPGFQKTTQPPEVYLSGYFRYANPSL